MYSYHSLKAVTINCMTIFFFLMCKGSSLRGYAIDCYSPSYCYAWTFSLCFSSMIDCRLNCDIFGLIGLRSRLTYFTFFEIAMLFQSKRWFTGIMSILRFVNRSFRNFWAMLIHRIHASLPHRAWQLTSQVGTWHWRDAFLSKCSRPSRHRFRQLFLRVFFFNRYWGGFFTYRGIPSMLYRLCATSLITGTQGSLMWFGKATSRVSFVEHRQFCGKRTLNLLSLRRRERRCERERERAK